ncbi:MAG: hypothetical protein LIP00_03550 [Parabacteroides sp.]|nr:hypothetical protein [Parabacteroides sp.]
MKKKLIALALLVGGLYSCSSDEKLVEKNPDFVAGNETLFSITVKNVEKPTGYAADAAYGELAATTEEKEVKNIAFFAKFKDADQVFSFFSKEELESDHGLADALQIVGEGEYTAKFKLTNTGEENVEREIDLIAVANYDENTTAEIKDIDTQEKLNAFLSKELNDMPSAPLLMLGTAQTKAKPGVVITSTFKLKRIAARVDIINEAGADLVLTSAKVLNAKKTAYLLPSLAEDSINKLPVFHYPTAVEPDAAAPDKIEQLYVYENLNVGDTATAIEIKGTYKGTALLKKIDFVKPKEDGVDTVVPILRNNLYRVRLYPTANTNDVDFTIQVEDWSVAADTFSFKPVYHTPEVVMITEESDIALVTDDADKQIYSVDISDQAATKGKKIVFYASGYQDTNTKVEYLGTTRCTGDSWMSAAISRTDIQGTYATDAPTNIKYRKYTITIPEMPVTATTPSDAFIKIHNAFKTDSCVTIRVKYRPLYQGIVNAKPVLYNGQFWAPVNVGATAVGLGKTDAVCGNYYQWGRNKVFAYPTTTPNDLVAGPVAENKFVTAAAEPYDWLIADDPNFEARNTMWVAGSDNYDSPCPEGWRVPTKNELDAIRKAYAEELKTATFAADMGLTVQADEAGNPLLLPAAGARHRTTGVAYGRGTEGDFWSCEAEGTGSWRLNFNAGGTNMNAETRAYAFTVRCVQE